MIPYIASYFLFVAAKSNKAFSWPNLDNYSFGQRLGIIAADWAFYLLIRTVCSTIRFTSIREDILDRLEAQNKYPIYSAWHDRIFLGSYYLRNRGLVFLVSQSFDGEYISRTLLRFGFGIVRGSSTRGGTKALVEAVRAMREGNPAGFTVDGPKGPRYVAKAGPVLLARKTGNPLLPFIIVPRRFVTINSWDKLQIPVPFTKGCAIYAEPITVEGDDDDVIEAHRQKLQDALDKLVEEAETWRKSG